MIQIAVNGELLDVPEQDITMSGKSLRFAEAISDEFSTDIELPRTQRNIAILGVYGLNMRGQLFGDRLQCFISTDLGNYDGYLTVDNVTEETITITLYWGLLPYESIDKKINEILTDDNTTFVPYGNHLINSGLLNVGQYDYYNSWWALAGQAEAVRYPLSGAISINNIFSRLGSALGWTFPTVNSELYLIATGNKQARNVPTVCVMAGGGKYRYQNTVQYSPQLGVSYEASPNWSASNHEFYLIADQKCTMKIDWYIYENQGVAGELLVTEADGTTHLLTNSGIQNQWHISTLTITVAPNAVTKLNFSHLMLKSHVLKFTPSGMVNTDKDDPQPLDLVGRMASDYSAAAWASCPQQPLCYQGVIQNLSDLTVRELLTGLCWYLGKKISTTGKTMIFRSAYEEKDLTGKATLTEWEPIYDGFGRKNYTDWAGCTEAKLKEGANHRELLFEMDCNRLEMEVCQQVLPFFRGAMYADNNGTTLGCTIPQWKWDSTDGGQTWTASAEDIDKPALVRVYYSSADGEYIAASPDPIQGLDIENTDAIKYVTFETYEPMRGYDYLIIDGFRVMVTEWETDENTGQTTGKGLIV